MTKDGVSQVDPTILIVAQPSTPYPKIFPNGVTVVVSDGRLNPLDPTSGHKTLDYWKNIRALQLAALVEPASCCGSLSPITWLRKYFQHFLICDGVLLTPWLAVKNPKGASLTSASALFEELW